MAGYENHAVSCAHCGVRLEAEVGRNGRLLVETEYFESTLEHYHEWGWLQVELGRYGVEWVDRDETDRESQGREDTLASEVRCPSCNGELDEDEFVLWAWDGEEDAVSDWMLQGFYGSLPERGPFEYADEGYDCLGEVMTGDQGRFVSSWQGELEDKAEAQVERVRQGVTLAQFEAAWDTFCFAESGEDDNGCRWSCELEHGHEGPHQFDRHEYYVEVDGVQVWAWDDESWVAGEVVPVGVSPQMAALLQADALAELGL